MTGVSEAHVLAALRDAIAIVLEVDRAEVGTATRLVEDLKADSLALVEIVEILEERVSALVAHPFHVDDADLDAITTVGAAVDYAMERLRAGAA